MTRYLTPADYSMQIRSEIKDLIGGIDEGKLIIAETAAVSEMKSYLKKRYNLDAIFFPMTKFTTDIANYKKDSLVFYKAPTDTDDKYLVYQANADVPSSVAPPNTGWTLFTARNPLVNMYLVDIALYHVHSKDATRMIPKIREDRYLDAMKWLTMVGKGQIEADLPTLPSDSPAYIPDIRFFSNELENQRW